MHLRVFCMGWLTAIALDSCQANGEAFFSSRLAVYQDELSENYWDLLQLALSSFATDKEEALDYLLEAERLGLGVADECDMLKIRRLKAQMLMATGQSEAARDLLLDLIQHPVCELQVNDHICIYNLLGASYLLRGEFDISLRYFLHALEMAEVESDSTTLATITGNIGFLYYKLSDYEKAVYFMNRRRSIDDDLGETSFLNLVNMSLCYAALGEYDRSEEYLRELMRNDAILSDRVLLLHINYAQGILDLSRSNLEQAVVHFETSLDLSREQNDDRMVLDVLSKLAHTKVLMNDWVEAYKCLKSAESRMGGSVPYNREMMGVYYALASIHERRGEWKEMAHYQQRYLVLRDSLYGSQRVVNLMEAEAELTARSSRRTIELQRKLLSSKDEALRWQYFSNVVLILIGVLIAALLGLVYRDLERSKRVRGMLEDRVRARTSELRAQQLELVRSIREQELRIQRIFSEVRNATRRIQGLCGVAAAETREEHIKAHLTKIHEQSKAIASAGLDLEVRLRTGLMVQQK